MAVIGRRHFVRGMLVTLLAGGIRAQGSRSNELRQQLGDIATALTAKDATAAMVPFSKRYAQRERLRDYFEGLTRAFAVVNEVDVLEENDEQDKLTATIRWTLTLTSADNGPSIQRSGVIQLKFEPEGKQWKITNFSPILVFDPKAADTPLEPQS